MYTPTHAKHTGKIFFTTYGENIRKRFVFPYCVVLYDVEKPQNLINIARTCEALGVYSLILIFTNEKLLERFKREYMRISKLRGYLKYLDLRVLNSWEDLLTLLRNNNVRIIAVECHEKAIPIFKVKHYPIPCAFVFGSERKGLSNMVLDSCDMIVRIPQYGLTGSLNVSTCVGIVLYDFLSKNIGVEYLVPSGGKYGGPAGI